MTDQERLIRLFDYDFWANHTIMDVLEENREFEKREKSLGLFYHIIGTHQHWYRRVTGKELAGMEIWPQLELSECSAHIEANHQRWMELLEKEHAELDQLISYQNSKGVEFETMLSDIMHHLIIHGQHHRSQIAMLLRMSEIAPPATDFIFYTRELDN